MNLHLGRKFHLEVVEFEVSFMYMIVTKVVLFKNIFCKSQNCSQKIKKRSTSSGILFQGSMVLWLFPGSLVYGSLAVCVTILYTSILRTALRQRRLIRRSMPTVIDSNGKRTTAGSELDTIGRQIKVCSFQKTQNISVRKMFEQY